ncbi:MAG: alpha/beta fold hydrolase [Puniceicoccaceae bacterium]
MHIVSLAHRQLGTAGSGRSSPLLLLHGLLGSSRNWQTSGRLLWERHSVYVPDLRNHGESPHAREMDYPSLAADVLGWMDREGIGKAHIVGHSMGGKVAMYLACRYKERFSSLTVVDIACRAYPPRWEKEFAVMQAMPVQSFTRRLEAEEWLEKDIRDWAFRKFLVSNLDRNPAGGFRWIVNLDILQAALPNLFQQVPAEGQSWEGPVLFLRGEQSRFFLDEDLAMGRRFFPAATLQTIADAGHNVHFDQPAAFVEAVLEHVGKAEG